MSYDVKCAELAAAFLNDEPTLPVEEVQVHLPKLAQRIQDTIEDYINYEMPTLLAQDIKGKILAVKALRQR